MFESFSDVWRATGGLVHDAALVGLLVVGALGLVWLGLGGSVLVLRPLDAWQRRRRLRAQLAREDARREAMARPKTRLAEHPLNRADDFEDLRERARAVFVAKGEEADLVDFFPKAEIRRLLTEDAEFMAWDRSLRAVDRAAQGPFPHPALAPGRKGVAALGGKIPPNPAGAEPKGPPDGA